MIDPDMFASPSARSPHASLLFMFFPGAAKAEVEQKS